MRRFAICSFLLLATAALHASPPGTTLVKFKLNTIEGKPWSLDDCKDKKAVVVLFIGTQCPINNAYMPKLVEMEKEFRDKGVQFVAINSNELDTVEKIAKHAKKHGLTFPVLHDDKHLVAMRFGAERHPTAYVLDGEHKISLRRPHR